MTCCPIRPPILVWTGLSPKSFHETPMPSRWQNAGERHQTHCVPRRHFSPCSVTDTPEGTHSTSCRAAIQTGDYKEIHTEHSIHRVPRVSGELNYDDTLPPTGEGYEDKEGMSTPEESKENHLAHLIDLLTSLIPAVAPATLHYRALQRMKNTALVEGRGNYNHPANLTLEGNVFAMDRDIPHPAPLPYLHDRV